MLVLTHSHPDHIGGAVAIKKGTGCQVCAHVGAKPWIEDVELQYKERPILNFHSLVEGPVQVDQELRDGDNLDLGDGQTLKVIHTPGHSKGSISLVYEQEGALFSGDAIPVAGAVPIYDEVVPSIRSIRKLKDVKNLNVLFASWDEPRKGGRLYGLMDEGLSYFQTIHDTVRKEKDKVSFLDPMDVAAPVLKSLGLPETALIPIVVRSIEAHLRVIEHANLLST
jgi:glyoxylase-like metal-dependent hydrolase (beta-lactamase superfamily II)